ncbi:TPA: aminoacetone oxidase family FAD-binding enzyme [Legionella pneumophila subsp. pneumophila]|uniref:NAD(P)/FAD-dependent oxidoreductase n=1 Tax=Legionella sp. PATHC039 TaxID=2992042 RepID=UPI001A285F20|nr:NAD(P)/FAD-dependent oxidoreductase [Legionella sp. PATHC039]HAT8858345.1 aminoacetone oxidase family FAD-binding enzyme [Legionella pneumophila subsp. pneumophila]MCW8396762.1 NAD(P)/FAD-dependent oxidoreductase [Legionella sp. PATHC039]HAT8889378.1 aminoacetone oxidase family FAD-binding enzyme [Legionella pneumophila subsp. pneumophila]HAT9650357.1 aminoacetone oxidase family FAD-binding enzyme [Legionella pneumophila subsp. pneumophila]HAT9920893.1 aminoacetone oxidase family FAD-bindin
MQEIDVLIIGAGAAGLMCAIEASKRKRKVFVLDHANKVGKKILMSGGGRCNFTNYYIEPNKYFSHNPHFFKSALSRYTQWDFIDLVNKHKIPFHEKTLGQLFCDNKSKDIVDMLLKECEQYGATIYLNTVIEQIQKTNDHSFKISTTKGRFHCHSVVIATGGLSIPTIGASPFAYKIAEQFNIKVWPTRAGLVPFTLDVLEKNRLSVLSGIGVDSLVNNERNQFREHILFTHRGLSGPAILQLSSYWYPGEKICVNLLPEHNLLESLKTARAEAPHKQLNSVLSMYLPKRVVEVFIPQKLGEKRLADSSNKDLETISHLLQNWVVKPNGTEGYRTAEVTIGGVDCHAISSKTMEANKVPGLYFIGEALDVTGWLGGYNFQWAWSSGWAAGQIV